MTDELASARVFHVSNLQEAYNMLKRGHLPLGAVIYFPKCTDGSLSHVIVVGKHYYGNYDTLKHRVKSLDKYRRWRFEENVVHSPLDASYFFDLLTPLFCPNESFEFQIEDASIGVAFRHLFGSRARWSRTWTYVSMVFRGKTIVTLCIGCSDLNAKGRLLLERTRGDLTSAENERLLWMKWTRMRRAPRQILIRYADHGEDSERSDDCMYSYDYSATSFSGGYALLHEGDRTENAEVHLDDLHAAIYNDRPVDLWCVAPKNHEFVWNGKGRPSLETKLSAVPLALAMEIWNEILQAAIVFAPLELPAYVLLWILDWEDDSRTWIAEVTRINILQSVVNSRRRVLAKREQREQRAALDLFTDN